MCDLPASPDENQVVKYISVGVDMVSSSRSEFLSDNEEFRRAGGCFVTTKRAIMFFLLAVCLALVVAGLMYFYGPSINSNQNEDDIEKLLNDTINELTEDSFQLSGLVQPMHYRLRLQPILNRLHYTGQVTITLKVLKRAKEIVLHSQNLKILNATLGHVEQVDIKELYLPLSVNESIIIAPNNSKTNNAETNISAHYPIRNNNTNYVTVHTSHVYSIPIQSVLQDNDSPLLKIKTAVHLEPSNIYSLHINFSGNITEDLKGFYKASFVDIHGKEQVIATTEFEPIHARRAFPCFDEPVFKATFEISIARRTNMIALSNMPLSDTEPMAEMQGWVWDHFKKSPPMSTYSVSFTVFNYTRITFKEDIGTVLKVWAPEKQLEGATYILQSAARIIKFLEHYLDVPFPLLKLDFVVIPNFIKESSENWGLIYISDESLIHALDSPDTSIEAKRKIFNAIAHELSHQWFGNLVSMKWWSDIWLFEGLASYLASIVEDSLEPTWDVLSNYAVDITEDALTMDKLKTTHSLRENISSVYKIEQMFDTLVKKKGSCLLRMLNYTVTEEQFKKGLQSLLKEKSFNTTTEEEFWASFPTGPNMVLPNITLQKAMESWTLQKGFPLVSITRNYSSGDVVLTQEKFLEQNETDDTLWYIPISYKVFEQKNVVKMWLLTANTSINFFTKASPDEWILLNIDASGFYRVNYDVQNWKLLIKQLQQDPSKISPSNRAQLIDDAFELAENGRLSYDIPIKLLSYLPTKETHYAPWASGLSNLQLLDIILHNTKFNGMFQTYLGNLIMPIYTTLFPVNNIQYSTSGELNERKLQKLILQTACASHFPPCIQWARNVYSLWMNTSNSSNPIPYYFRDIVYCTAIKMGGKKEWEFLWNKTTSPLTPGDLKNAYSALGCSRDPWLINSYLEHTLDGSISTQNIPLVWQSITRSVGLHVGFKFLRLNWNEIYNKFGDMYTIMQTIFEGFISHLSTKVDLEDLTMFYRFNTKSLKSVSPLVKQSVDKIKLRIYWWEKHMANVTKWLDR